MNDWRRFLYAGVFGAAAGYGLYHIVFGLLGAGVFLFVVAIIAVGLVANP